MKKKLIALSGSMFSFVPMLALAQNAVGGCNAVEPGTIQAIICRVGNIIDLLIPILVVLGVLYFVWGVVQYVIASDEEAKGTGRQRMIYGIIGLVVIVAMWGLVGIVTRTFGLNGSAEISIPTVPF